MKIKITVIDDKNQTWEGNADLTKINSRRTSSKKQKQLKSSSFRPNSISSQIIDLIERDFFTDNKTIQDIIKKLQSRGHIYKSPQLTDSLLRLVRQGRLEKTKDHPTGEKSKLWMYFKS